MTNIDQLGDAFWDLHSGLPREGPGDDDSTLRALAMCTELPEKPDILDVGCGPGMQTVALARATNGALTAVDFHEPFLDQLRENAVAAGVRERIHVMRGDMADLPFGPDSFDLIWSEGAAYIMGITEAFTAWQEFVRPGGYVVVSELTWLVADVPAEVYDFFTNDYPGVRGIASNLERIEAAGYDIVGHFTLPTESWWTHYQTPLDAKLPELREKYAGDEAALAVIDETAEEHRISREFPDVYGYEFYVARCRFPDGPAPRPAASEDETPVEAPPEPEPEPRPEPEYPPPLD
jgi:SAM-dependent methyltransferase